MQQAKYKMQSVSQSIVPALWLPPVCLARCAHDEVNVNASRRLCQIESMRQHAVFQGHDGDGRLNGAGGAQQVAKGAL